jgi:hypothetical protein
MVVSAVSIFTSAIPHFGQLPGFSLRTSGCMVHVYSTFSVDFTWTLVLAGVELLQAVKVRDNAAIANVIKIDFFIFLDCKNDSLLKSFTFCG